MLTKLLKSLFLSCLISFSLSSVYFYASLYAFLLFGLLISLGIILAFLTFISASIAFYQLGNDKKMINRLILVFLLIVLMEIAFYFLNENYHIINYLFPIKPSYVFDQRGR